jgi:outer membrane biosynthesis protein TonB
VIVGLLAVIALAGGGLWFTRSKDPVPEPVKDPPIAVKEPVKKDPEPEAKTEPENPDPAKELTVLTREKHENAWKLQMREDGYVFVLGADDKLSEGDRLDIAGEDEGDGMRPVYAHGGVMEIKGSIVSVLLDDDETPLPKMVFAARDLSGVNHTTKPPKKTPVKKDPVAKKDPEPTKDPVKEPVKKDPEPTKEPVKVAEPAKVTAKQLYGKVKISAPDKRTKIRTVLMVSENPFPLTNCELRLPMNFSSRVNDIAPNDKGTLAFNYFRQDGRAPLDQFANDWSAMYCAEGSGYWKTSYEK